MRISKQFMPFYKPTSYGTRGQHMSCTHLLKAAVRMMGTSRRGWPKAAPTVKPPTLSMLRFNMRKYARLPTAPTP